MIFGLDCKMAIDVYTQILWLDWRRPGVINVSSRPRHQDLLWRDRDETRDPSVRDRDETETMRILIETRPRRDADTSRDRLETETSRPRLHPWLWPHLTSASDICHIGYFLDICICAVYVEPVTDVHNVYLWFFLSINSKRKPESKQQYMFIY